MDKLPVLVVLWCLGSTVRAQDLPRVPLLPAATSEVVAPAPVAAAAARAGSDVSVRDRSGNELMVESTLPDGERVIRREWIMLVTREERVRLNGEAGALMGFLSSELPFALIQGQLLTFRVPSDFDNDLAIQSLLPPDLRDQIDRNHLYAPRAFRTAQLPLWLRSLGAPRKSAAPLLPMPWSPVCDGSLRIGMVDTQVDLRHPAFTRIARAGNRVMSRSFLEGDLPQADRHGTAVASLWLGELDGPTRDTSLRPLLPNAVLHNATIFHVNDLLQEGASAARVLAALDWLAGQEGLRVVNMSLAGPPNRLLEQTIELLHDRSVHIVAAVGNEGPHGPPRYPAAYDKVLAVAAVDRAGEIFRWSNQGEHVDYSAFGVNVPSAADEPPLAPQSGTSLAAPVVTAFLACVLHRGVEFDEALRRLDGLALDRGEPGPDPVHGRGLLHP